MIRKTTYDRKAVDRAVISESRKGLLRAAVYLEREIKNAMRYTVRQIGRSYKVKYGISRSAAHHPSAPGFPPAVDTGRLMGSITHATSWGLGGSKPKPPAKADDGVTGAMPIPNAEYVVVGSNVQYLHDLEMGTPKVKARPVLRPTLAKNAAAIVEKIAWSKPSL